GLHADAELDELIDLLEELLAAHTSPGLLILDDAHVLEGDSIAVVSALAEHVPAGSTLALLTREPPAFPVTRGVIHGSVRVLDADALAMTAAEAGHLLAHSGVATGADAVEVLTDVTEGWPAGLYLASL